jgi:hypothetical protein
MDPRFLAQFAAISMQDVVIPVKLALWIANYSLQKEDLI